MMFQKEVKQSWGRRNYGITVSGFLGKRIKKKLGILDRCIFDRKKEIISWEERYDSPDVDTVLVGCKRILIFQLVSL